MTTTDVERNLERIRWLCDPLASTAEAEEFAALLVDDEEGDEGGGAPTLFHSTPGCRAVPDGEMPAE